MPRRKIKEKVKCANKAKTKCVNEVGDHFTFTGKYRICLNAMLMGRKYDENMKVCANMT